MQRQHHRGVLVGSRRRLRVLHPPRPPGAAGGRGQRLMGGATQGRAADAFRRITGRSPDGVWSAPGRVNLIGEHTDYSGGLVLPIAIDRRATVAAGLRNDDVIRCASLQFGGEITATAAAIRPGDGNGWAAPLLGVAWAVGTAGVGVPGAALVVDSDIPPGGGLASSAAVEVAAALALTELTRQRMSTGELAFERAAVEKDGLVDAAEEDRDG